ncbi:winged helix-turn-helix transcriptional regulator [Streptomyces nigra]|uniref:winged helix-turn-helix transcriptional regulator n=1 Tax=Streptomyces nigra TaxID=1827580 RepID=UPI0036802059
MPSPRSAAASSPHTATVTGDLGSSVGVVHRSAGKRWNALHRLLANGLIERHAQAGVQPRVEYALTALGRSLVEGPMAALGRWALEHGDELLEARERG